MKSYLRPTLAALALGLASVPATRAASGDSGQMTVSDIPGLRAALPATNRSALQSPEAKAAQLDQLTSLSADQSAKATEIFRIENAALEGLDLGDGSAETTQTWVTTRETSRNDIRALLTPAQLSVYERARQNQGGGLLHMAPEDETARLDRLVGLSPAQQAVALQIFQEELETLLDLPAADRLVKGGEARQAAKAQTRAILTPEQQKKYDRTPPGEGGGMPGNPENMVASLDQVVSLSAAQKAQAGQIFWSEMDAQLATATPDRPLKGFTWRQPLRDQLRAILTPEQQVKFDAAPLYSGKRPGARKSGG